MGLALCPSHSYTQIHDLFELGMMLAAEFSHSLSGTPGSKWEVRYRRIAASRNSYGLKVHRFAIVLVEVHQDGRLSRHLIGTNVIAAASDPSMIFLVLSGFACDSQHCAWEG